MKILCTIFGCLAALTTVMTAHAEPADTLQTDSAQTKTIHRVELEGVTGIILHTNDYLRGDNQEGRTMNKSVMARLKYAFQLPQGSEQARIYGDPYQGVGMAMHSFNPQLGNPVSVFLFQGARIKRFSPLLSLNYEWNFGLSMGWNPHDDEKNPENHTIGSKATAYMDVDLYLNWRLNRYVDLNTGLQIAHFSNGNTRLPNAGLNIAGLKVGVACYLNRDDVPRNAADQPLPAFRRHWNCDVMLFGAWRSKGVYTLSGDDRTHLIPGSDAVYGFNISPLYAINHWLHAGVSLDGVYDRCANIHIQTIPTETDAEYVSVRPSSSQQMALGLSARGEFTMPFFNINAGMGYNIFGHGDQKGFYQVLALKIKTSRRCYLNIGYTLQDFSTPKHLMLGLGYKI